jgi:hypothetical protein
VRPCPPIVRYSFFFLLLLVWYHLPYHKHVLASQVLHLAAHTEIVLLKMFVNVKLVGTVGIVRHKMDVLLLRLPRIFHLTLQQ